MTTVSSPAAPRIDAHTAMTVLFAGALATVAFDFFGQALSPLLGYPALAPVPLAQQTINVVFGVSSKPLAYALHTLTGLIAYPLGWMLIVEPLRRALAPSVPWALAAVAYGVALWVFALYIMASLVAGNPPFLGFGGITWVALIGHMVFALVAAAVIERRCA